MLSMSSVHFVCLLSLRSAVHYCCCRRQHDGGLGLLLGHAKLLRRGLRNTNGALVLNIAL